MAMPPKAFLAVTVMLTELPAVAEEELATVMLVAPKTAWPILFVLFSANHKLLSGPRQIPAGRLPDVGLPQIL